MKQNASKKTNIWLVQVAQYDESNGELIPFAKAFATLEQAAKFVVTDYNDFCKSFEDDGDTGPNLLSKTAWAGLAETKTIVSPSDWPTWIKWEIKPQSITL